MKQLHKVYIDLLYKYTEEAKFLFHAIQVFEKFTVC